MQNFFAKEIAFLQFPAPYWFSNRANPIEKTRRRFRRMSRRAGAHAALSPRHGLLIVGGHSLFRVTASDRWLAEKHEANSVISREVGGGGLGQMEGGHVQILLTPPLFEAYSFGDPPPLTPFFITKLSNMIT